MYKRRVQRLKGRSFGSWFELRKGVKMSKWKFEVVKVVVSLVVVCILLGFVKNRSAPEWIWGSRDERYISDLDMDWDEISLVVLNNSEDMAIKHVGILNFNNKEIREWQQLIPSANHTVLHLDSAEENTRWEALYPEWIDEEQEEEVPLCPSLPTAALPKQRLDLLVVKLPCLQSNWSRDIARLHLQIAAAHLAASHKGTHPLHLLFVTNCFPIPSLFNCKDLVARQTNTWLYRPNLSALREKLHLPIGSCELALPLPLPLPLPLGQHYSRKRQREAYATILHSNYVYVCGAIVVAQSIKMSGSNKDLVILVDKHISDYHRSGLELAGWQVRTIDRIRNPRAEKDSYNEWNYSKFRLWQLTDYDKIIFIDSDLLILNNIDFLFTMPELSATGNHEQLFNSGVMVIEPSNCMFELLMDHVNHVESYNGGDQGYLNEILTWWHRIPRQLNFLKHFWIGDDDQAKRRKIQLFEADPPILHVLHYLGNKPWMCFRDYDCNWNVDVLREFASDAAHARWWRVHDAMEEKLHHFCLLRALQKAQLEWDRRQAERGNYSDGHWRLTIQDQRIHSCIDQDCDWQERLRHWGKNANASSFAA